MGQINSLQETLGQQYGDKVEYSAFNVIYDDTEGIHELITHIVRNAIALPVVYIDGQLELKGYVDEPTVLKIIEQKSLK